MASSAPSMEFDTEARSSETAADAAAALWCACLARVAAEADREAFRELYDHFAPLIRAFAWKVSSLDHPEQFADELVQETMLKVWTGAASFNPKLASPGTWVFTLARNMRIDLLRRRARHIVNSVSLQDEDSQLDTDDIWFVDAGSDLFNQLAQQRSRRQIREALQTLPPEQAAILQKVYMEDKSHAEVAAELALPLGTVKSRVRLALNKLKLVVDR
jgi:RNA polymerase sigma-70 factor (ECF subfamily)